MKNKYTGNHTSLTPAANLVCKILEKDPLVDKISPGFIKAGLKPNKSGRRRVKTEIKSNYILFSIRGNTSHQEIHVYTKQPDEVTKNIKKELPDFEM